MSTLWSEDLPSLEWPGEPEEEAWTAPFTPELAPWEYERIGATDERVLIADTRRVPFRWVCSLDITFDKRPKNWKADFGRGSGLLVGPRQVLTAAHNIYPDGKTGPESVYVSPGRNEDDEPFGRVKATAWSVLGSAFGAGRIEPWYDFAVVTLEHDIANQSFKTLGNKPLGYWGSPKLGQGTKMKPLAIKNLTGKPVSVCGYPGDRCGTKPYDPKTQTCSKKDHASTQWSAVGTVSAMPNSSRRFLHTADTHAGQSGSPVWIKFGNGARWVVGVHISADPVVVNGQYLNNVAVHLSEPVLAAVRGWIPELSR